jgi:hypothetical protein
MKQFIKKFMGNKNTTPAADTTPPTETKTYPDGTTATGPGPLPDESPAAPASPPVPPVLEDPAVAVAKLQKAVKAASDGLGVALRTLIHNRIHDGTPDRNRLENAFENAVNSGTTYAHLLNAADDLKLAVTILSNHSLKNESDLGTVKEAHAAATSAVNALKPKA